MRSRGFTMIELVVVMAILAILASAALPLSEAIAVAARERELRDGLRQIRRALDDYKIAVDSGRIARRTASGYPVHLLELEQGALPVENDAAGPMYFLRRLPRDPLADASLPAERTWRVRSYASPPDHPAPGEDVYDIRSSSDATALDGSAYAQW